MSVVIGIAKGVPRTFLSAEDSEEMHAEETEKCEYATSFGFSPCTSISLSPYFPWRKNGTFLMGKYPAWIATYKEAHLLK